MKPTMAEHVIEVVVKLTNQYIAAEKPDRKKFLEDWCALGYGVELVAKESGPVSVARIIASRGGKKGSVARYNSTTDEQRSADASRAARARWSRTCLD